MAERARRFPLIQYLQVEQAYVSEIDKILRKAAKDNADRLNALPDSANPLTRAQLKAQAAAIKANLAQDWTNIQKAIDNGQKAAAARASEVLSAYENDVLSAVLSRESMDALIKSEAQRAASGVRTLMDRLESSKKPLSENVYNTKKLTEGWVDREINAALVAGLSAAQLAKQIRQFIDPAVPGGASYAARRLARTEINNAFHAATQRRMKESQIVEEVDWNLSTSHPEGDVCDSLASDSPYPEDEVPEKPHPQCLCFLTPRLPDQAEFIDNLFAGKYGDEPWEDEALQNADVPTPPTKPSAAAKTEAGGFNLDRLKGIKQDPLYWDASKQSVAREDLLLKEMLDQKGFNGLPRIVSPKEFDAAGQRVLYRALGETEEVGKKYAAQLMYSDDPYIGLGYIGNGTYFSATSEVSEAFGKYMSRAYIDPNARGITVGELADVTYGARGTKGQDFLSLWKKSNKGYSAADLEIMQQIVQDQGRLATYLGYDYIDALSGYMNEVVILNRKALVFRGA